MAKPYIKYIIKKFNTENVRYLLIGRQAVVLYGFPVTSFDYDFWVYPEDRKKVYKILLKEDFEPSSNIEEKKPIVFFIKDIYKIDIFFVKAFSNLKFEDCYKRAKIFKEAKFVVRVAQPKDIIFLKKFRSTISEEDKKDIKFLINFKE